MIEQKLLEVVREDIGIPHNMTVTKNYRTSKDNYIVIYDMGSDPVNNNDDVMYYNGVYHIEIGSSDFDKAKQLSYAVFHRLNDLINIDIDTNLFSQVDAKINRVTLINMLPERLPSRLGVENDVMVYTLTYSTPIVLDCN